MILLLTASVDGEKGRDWVTTVGYLGVNLASVEKKMSTTSTE